MALETAETGPIRSKKDLVSTDSDLVSELDRRFRAHLRAATKALKAAVADPWVEGSKGQLVAHPGYAVAAKLDLVALRIAGELRHRDAGLELPTSFDRLDGLDEIARRRGASRR